ncbi:uncharacterized protein LOC141907422 isoform X2 [Tubulanus polymorphus]|uniref:uncharacterized protein LOC141907422 isoform X2 n=1 Tax=Tubulanus polymorphus TaxID=672921 RepID=UPI003DA1FA99
MDYTRSVMGVFLIILCTAAGLETEFNTDDIVSELKQLNRNLIDVKEMLSSIFNADISPVERDRSGSSEETIDRSSAFSNDKNKNLLVLNELTRLMELKHGSDYNRPNAVKRQPPNGFYAVRGKRASQEILSEKRTPTGFHALRGKRSSVEM